MPTLKLSVPSLGDGPDARRLERAYAGERGVFGVVASCGGHCIEIDFEDDEVTPLRLIEIARNAGFDAKIAS